MNDSTLSQDQKLFIEILISAVNGGGFDKKIPDRVFLSYLELSSIKDQYLKNFKEKYKKEPDWQQEPESETDQNQDDQLQALKRLAEKVNPTGEEFHDPEILTNEHLLSAFQYYCFNTGQVEDKSFKLLKLRQETLHKFDKMIKVRGKKILLHSFIQDLKDQSHFSGYEPPKIQAVRVADVCWNLYGENSNITKEELLKIIPEEYSFKRYRKDSAKEQRGKIKKTITQWIADVEKHNGIIIREN